MNWNDENGDGGAFGQAFQRQFKRSIGVPGEPSTNPMAPKRGDLRPPQPMMAPLRGPRGGFQLPTPRINPNWAGQQGDYDSSGIIPPGPHMDQNPDFPMTEDGSPWHPPALGEGRRKDYISTENPVGLGYDPTSQNDMAGLALRGYYRDENNNWQMRPNPNRAPAPGRSNGRPMGAPPAPPPMPIPPGTGGLDPVGPGGGLGGPQGRDRMPGNFAAQPPQTKTPDNGWQWGDLNNLTNRWKG